MKNHDIFTSDIFTRENNMLFYFHMWRYQRYYGYIKNQKAF